MKHKFTPKTAEQLKASGATVRHVNGIPHGDGKPAITYPSGTVLYFEYGKPHRLDGPALNYPDGKHYYFLFGRQVSYKTWAKYVAG